MKKLVIYLLLLYTAYAADATMEVVKNVQSLPSIALEDASQPNANKIEQKILKLILSDLNVLSLFNVDRNVQKAEFDRKEVVYKNKEFDYVLRVQSEYDEGDGLLVSVKFFKQGQSVFKKSYTLQTIELYPFIVHTIAYDVNKELGAKDVSWIKRKVIFSKLTRPGESEIVVGDYTLSYQSTILKGGINVFPKWANKEQSQFYYTSLNGNKPVLYHINIPTKSRSKVAESEGMLVCSDVSSDGNKLLLTMAPNGKPDVYMMDIRTKQYKRLTFYSGIDVNGQFLNGDKIAFVSDRLGYPNIFSKKIGSKAVEQVVYYGRNNVSCNAHGDYIVYSSRESDHAFESNTFNLHMISLKSDFIRRLTATGVNEFPRFSYDGSVVLFMKTYKRQSAIGLVRLEYNKNFLFPLQSGELQSMDW